MDVNPKLKSPEQIREEYAPNIYSRLSWLENKLHKLVFQENTIDVFFKRFTGLYNYYCDRIQESGHSIIEICTEKDNHSNLRDFILSSEFIFGWYEAFDCVISIPDTVQDILDDQQIKDLQKPKFLNLLLFHSKALRENITDNLEMYLVAFYGANKVWEPLEASDCYLFDHDFSFIEKTYYQYKGFVRRVENEFLTDVQDLIDLSITDNKTFFNPTGYISSSEIMYDYKVPRTTLQSWQERDRPVTQSTPQSNETLFPKAWFLGKFAEYKEKKKRKG